MTQTRHSADRYAAADLADFTRFESGEWTVIYDITGEPIYWGDHYEVNEWVFAIADMSEVHWEVDIYAPHEGKTRRLRTRSEMEEAQGEIDQMTEDIDRLQSDHDAAAKRIQQLQTRRDEALR